MPPNLKNPPENLVNHVALVHENRDNTFAAQTKQFDASSLWLADAIQSCKRKVLEGTGDVVDEPVKRVKADVSSKENSNPNSTAAAMNGKGAAKEAENNRIMSLKVAELRDELRRLKLDTAGRKKELQRRLIDHVATQEAAAGSGKAEKSAVVEEKSEAVVPPPPVESNDDVVTKTVAAVETKDSSGAKAGGGDAHSKAFVGESKPALRKEEADAPVEVDSPVVDKKRESTVATSLLKTTASIFSPSKLAAKIQAQSQEKKSKKSSPNRTSQSSPSLRTAITQGITKKASALFSSSPSEKKRPMVPSASSKAAIKKPVLEQSKSNSTGEIKAANEKSESAVKGPSSAPAISVPSISTSLKAKHKVLSDARKARLAEIRGKSKPIALSKSGPSTETPSLSSARLLKTSALKKGPDEKRHLLTTQMREKAAAAVKPPTIVPSVPSVAPGEHSKAPTNPSSSQRKVLTKPPSESKPKTASNSQLRVPANPYQSGSKLKSTPTGAMHRDVKAEHRDRILSPMDTYEISDRDTDSEDSDSEDEYQANPKKKIPEWAQKKNLIPALERQYDPTEKRLNPDFIFPEVDSCNLEEIFDKKKDRYKSRASTGNWTKDRVTVTEKLVYSRSMGYDET